MSWHVRPCGWLIWLAGEEQPDNAAVIPDRLVVLYSTHRPEFPWEKIGGGKASHTTPAGSYVSKLIICTGSIVAITVPEKSGWAAWPVSLPESSIKARVA